MADPIIHVPSRARLKRVHGGRDILYPFLEHGNTFDLSEWKDDFKGDTLHGGYQSTASGTGALSAAISTGVVNGAILLDAGTDDAGRSDLSLGLHYRGDLNCVVWARANLNTIGSSKFEIGFTDVISGTDAGAVNVKATPSFTATDCVVLVRDTTDDTNLTLVGNANGTAATAIDFTSVLASNTYYYFGVALRDGAAKGFLLDALGLLLEETAWMASAVTATVLLTPWLFVQNRSTGNRTLTVDYLTSYQRRTT